MTVNLSKSFKILNTYACLLLLVTVGETSALTLKNNVLCDTFCNSMCAIESILCAGATEAQCDINKSLCKTTCLVPCSIDWEVCGDASFLPEWTDFVYTLQEAFFHI
ncbi:uncharacterized protein LOC131957041 [Physella acuta]|uniref:uncharacterized protein LOC131957041 n=1 Tax=Physella acuta TaxID=109671 RepID=UPI0027DC4753|nr:uncharacterized protein LOC131957041 [Physella acuta]